MFASTWKLATGGFVFGLALGVLLVPGALQKLLPPREPQSVGEAQIGGAFTLVDQTGKAVSEADFRGRPMLVYFGYAADPDIAPAALQVMSAAIDRTGRPAGDISALFITLDPVTDTPARLASFTTRFHPRITGLTGTPDQIAAAARVYKVWYRQVPASTASGSAIEHTTHIYLMGKDGRYIAHFSPTSHLADIAAGLKKAL